MDEHLKDPRAKVRDLPSQDENPSPVRVGPWILRDVIGSGSFAVVWRASHVITGEEAALKEINVARLNPKLRRNLDSEIATMRRVRHSRCGKRLNQPISPLFSHLFNSIYFCACTCLYICTCKGVDEKQRVHDNMILVPMSTPESTSLVVLHRVIVRYLAIHRSRSDGSDRDAALQTLSGDRILLRW